MPPGSSLSRVLVIDSREDRATEVAAVFASLGVEVERAADADEGWRCFVDRRPPVVLAALATSGKGGDAFLRRLNSEYMGAMPRTFLICDREELRSTEMVEPDGILVPPIPHAALRAIVEPKLVMGETASRQATRWRELYDMSLLGADIMRAVDALVNRAALAFQVADCVIWGSPAHLGWPHTAREIPDDELDAYLEHCELAAAAQVTVMVARRPPSAGTTSDAHVVDDPGRSFLGDGFGSPGGVGAGGMCLVSDDLHLFTPDERDAVRVLTRRTGWELAWVSAHNRVVAEHEKLRESALLDPMLGVWTRSAFEHAIVGQISAAHRRRDPTAIAIMDFSQLRSINDRYGHVIGDAVLTHFAETIRSNVGLQDMVGRFGGDELAILFVGVDLKAARVNLEGLIRILQSTPFSSKDIVVPMDISVGLTAVGRDETNGEGAFARAAEAERHARQRNELLWVTDADNDWGTPSEVLAIGNEDGLPAGSTLGGMYRILHEISRGAMGVVYRGEDLGLGRPVAIKVLRSDLSRDTELVARFRAEATMHASLHHANLVEVYAFGSEGDDVYFVMELVEGEPLSDVIIRLSEADEYIDLEAVEKIVEEIADALEAIHSVGIIHRDVKPANILLDRINDRAALVDVGVAKRREDATDAAGTPGFAAPESFMDEAETSATDVYGLAATTYTMLTGLAPFGGGEVVEVVNRQLFETAQPPSAIRRDLDEAVDSVLAKALSPNQPDRYSSAAAFAIALSRAIARTASGKTPLPRALARRRQRARIERKRPPTLTAPSEAHHRALSQATEVHQSRGAWFRVAHKLLTHHLGEKWIADTIAAHPELASVLTSQLSPTSWLPLDLLVQVLNAATASVRNPHKLARSLGRITVNATLPRFFGADPALQTPGALLRAAEAYWGRYHTWGQLSVATGELSSTVTVASSAGQRLVCAMTAGALGRIAEIAGGQEVVVSHPMCVHDGASMCQFFVRWESVEVTLTNITPHG